MAHSSRDDLWDDSKAIEKEQCRPPPGNSPPAAPSPCASRSRSRSRNNAALFQTSSRPRAPPKGHSLLQPGREHPHLVAVLRLNVTASGSPTTAGTCCSHRKALPPAVFLSCPRATKEPSLSYASRIEAAADRLFPPMPCAPMPACSPSFTPRPASSAAPRARDVRWPRHDLSVFLFVADCSCCAMAAAVDGAAPEAPPALRGLIASMPSPLETRLLPRLLLVAAYGTCVTGHRRNPAGPASPVWWRQESAVAAC